MGTIAIAEKTQDGLPMVMVMNSQRMISIQSKKRTGRKRDYSHDLDDYYEANPLIAQEIFDRNSVYAPMSQELQAFVDEMWEMAEELDPWFITDPVEVEDMAMA
jgi:hypothetical protein